MKKLLAGLLSCLPFVANAQFAPGQVLTAAELNSQFSLYAPLAGATFSGPLVTGSLTVTGSANLPPIALSALATQAANTVLANVTASSATPTAFAMPSCSTSASALTYTTSTGFTCNTAVNAAQLGGATFASPTAIGSGTPSTGAFTTLSASSGLNSTAVGNTTASTGAFTTLSATSTVNGAGFTSLFASPPAIGSTAASTGAFTTLSATSTVSGAGFTSLFASPPAIGGTAASTGAFTNLSSSGTVSGTGFSTYLASPPAIGGTTAAAGSFTTLSSTGNFTPSQTNGIVGTTTNNNANAGSVGEYVTATGSAVSLSTTVQTNITSISLTAGDWDVTGSIEFDAAGSTTTQASAAGVNTVSATLPAEPLKTVQNYGVTAGLASTAIAPLQRLSLASTTTVYLVGYSQFAVSTMTATGTIRARRIR